jgi:fermentation-respiration switch protein FrsA (DUF1100 family)
MMLSQTERGKVAWEVMLILLAFIVFAVLGIGWYASEKVIHPLADPSLNPDEFGLPLEEVSFQSRDGLRLAGWFLDGSNGATIILAHGRGSDHTHMLPEARFLYEGGFSVLLFDFRYRGKSGGDAQTIGAKEAWDVESALDYLKTRRDVDPERIGVHGNSMGAVASIMATSARREIKGLIGEIPFSSVNHMLNHSFRQEVRLPGFPFAIVTKWICELRLGIDLDRLAPVQVIDKISPRQILLIDDEEDTVFPSDAVELLYAAASEPKQIWKVADCPHGQARQCAPEEFERRVVAFWRETFRIVQPVSPAGGI